MKALKFSKNSWHYWLATFGDDYRKLGDICSYTRAVIKGSMLFSLVVLLVIGATVIHANLFAWISSMIVYQTMFAPEILAGMGVGLYLLIFVLLLIGAINYLWNQYCECLDNQPDNFVAHAYHSFKDKFCVKVEIVEEK